jgi:uncharacterized protein YceK
MLFRCIFVFHLITLLAGCSAIQTVSDAAGNAKAATYKNQCSASTDASALSNQLPSTKILWHDGPPRDEEHLHVYLIGTAPTGAPQKSCSDKGGWMKKAEEKAKAKAEKAGEKETKE